MHEITRDDRPGEKWILAFDQQHNATLYRPLTGEASSRMFRTKNLVSDVVWKGDFSSVGEPITLLLFRFSPSSGSSQIGGEALLFADTKFFFALYSSAPHHVPWCTTQQTKKRN